MPLIKSCSLDAFHKNLKTEIDAGKDRSQAFAIAINTLKRSCGVESDDRMSPEEIVAKKESTHRTNLYLLIQEAREALNESRAKRVKEVNKFIANLDKKIGLTKNPQDWKTIKDAFNDIVGGFGMKDAIYAMGSKDGRRVFELDGGVNLVWIIYTFESGRVELNAYAT